MLYMESTWTSRDINTSIDGRVSQSSVQAMLEQLNLSSLQPSVSGQAMGLWVNESIDIGII